MDNIAENIDRDTVAGFGKEWSSFDQPRFQGSEFERTFQGYFDLFPFDELRRAAEGFDLGCGSGRWAAGVTRRVGQLHCIDLAAEAQVVARQPLSSHPNVDFSLASAATIPLPDSSQDFGYSLGVLHHIPDTARALADCVRKLKPGGPFLLYIYYDFENHPAWFRAIWRGSDALRKLISRMPFALRKAVTTAIAVGVYFPLARLALLAGRPDRFGTKLEQRFSRKHIEEMVRAPGLDDIRFRESEPIWVACGRRVANVADGNG